MRAGTQFLLVAMMLIGVGGCHKSPTSPSGQGLPGTWRATQAEYVSGANSTVRQEVVSRGTVMTLTLNVGGSYTLVITDPGEAPQSTGGSWSASSDVLTLRPTNISGEMQFDMTLSGNTLRLAGGHVLFDFGDGGGPQESILSATFLRQ